MTADQHERFRRATARHAAGDRAGAADEYRALLALAPGDVDLLYHLGIAEHQLGHGAEAMRALDRTTQLAPDFAEAWQSLGHVRLAAGDDDGATDAYAKALRLRPAWRGLRGHLIGLLQGRGALADALATALAGLRAQADDTELWSRLAQGLDDLVARQGPDAVRVLAARALADLAEVADRAVAAGVVLRWPAVQMALTLYWLLPELCCRADSPAAALSVLARPAWRDAVVTTLALEAQLTRLRRVLLTRHAQAPARLAELPLDGLAALAARFHLQEYAACVDDGESALLPALATQLAAGLARGRIDPHGLALLACYQGLASLPAAAELLRLPLPDALRALLRQQVAEPLAEARLAAAMPQLTPIRDATSLAVGALYEASPYPRWRELPVAVAPLTDFAAYLESLLPGLAAPPALRAAAFPVLIAGCGTGFQVLAVAARLPQARVLAVDISRASLAYAQRKALESGCPNVRFAQADLLELGELGERFPYIECSGVLHHLADPLAGLKVLASRLSPGGVIRLALYSERARQHFGVLAGQQRARAGGYPPTAEGIRRFRRDVFFTGENGGRLAELRDIHSLSECRDLLFHVMEHRFDPPGLGRLCAAAGLRFAGFREPQAGVFARYDAQFPDDPARLDLANWDRFEQASPGLFIHMYSCYAQRAA